MITGKQINNVCKTATVLNAQINSAEPRVLDPAHVAIIEVSTHDGSPVFGVAGSFGIDMKDLMKLKLDDTEEFEASIGDKFHYVLNGDGCTYKVKTIDASAMRIAKRPLVTYTSKAKLDIKRFKKALDAANEISDHVTLKMKDNMALMLEAGDDTANFGYQVGTVEYAKYNETSKFPVDFLKRIAKVLTSDATIQIGIDYPLTISWTDEYYKYDYLLAPRVGDDA